jgi:hypothetical protein
VRATTASTNQAASAANIAAKNKRRRGLMRLATVRPGR